MGGRRAAKNKKKLKDTHGTLLVEDESGFSLIPNLGRTWSPRGNTPTLTHNFSWKRISTIGAVTLDGRIYFQAHKGTIRTEQVIGYLEQILKEMGGCHVVLLWDGAPVHRAAAVNEFLRKNEKRITAFRLPPYHPKFNPTEFLWSYLKVAKMRGFCPMQVSDLKKKITGCVRSAKRKPDMVRSYFRASAIPIGDGAEEKLSRYCRPELIRKLCIYQ